MEKKISMQQIADRLGLSKYAISKALSGKRGVSEETRQQILETAKAMGYRTKVGVAGNKAQSSLSSNQNYFALILMPQTETNENGFWGRVLAGIVNGCKEIGWDHLIVSHTGEDREFSFPSYADLSSCAGIIVAGKTSASLLLSMKKHGFPIILVEHEEPAAHLDIVMNDSFDAAGSMCRRMVSSGCRSILFIGVEHHSISYDERWRGCRIAIMEENEKRRQPISLTKILLPLEGSRMKQLEQLVQKQMEAGLPECFICTNDYIALILLEVLKRSGYRVPEQCKIVGFDNIERSSYSDPPLTTVDLCKELLGFRAVEALQRRVSKPGQPPEKVMLSSSLIVRQSG